MSADVTSDARPGLGYRQQGAGAPLVLVHGFTQTSGSWGDLATALGRTFLVRAVDAPGHGSSGPLAADLVTAGRLLADLGPAAFIGYSMGGRMCLQGAVEVPRAFSKLVLVSTSAGIDDEDERAARRRSDDALAGRLLDEGVERFVDWWLTTPLFATLRPDDAARQSRLANTATGLASSLRLAGAGTQEPLWDRLHLLSMPVLIVTGALDTKYTGLGRRLADAIGPNASHTVLAGAGHACHLERPEAFLAAVSPFLSH